MAETETRCKYNVEVDDEARHNVNTEIQKFDRRFSQEQRVAVLGHRSNKAARQWK